jgi:hypothetical protein
MIPPPARYQPAPVWRCHGSSLFPGEEPAISATGFLANPAEQPLPQAEPAGEHQVDEEAVGLEVVDHVPAVVASILGPVDVGPRRLAVEVGEQMGAPRRDENEGRAAGHAWGFEHLPSVDKTVVPEVLKPQLRGSNAGEEEVTDLERGEVAVVVKGLEDTAISLRKRTKKLSGLVLGERSGGLLGNGTKNERTSRNRSPSWYQRRTLVNSPLNSA